MCGVCDEASYYYFFEVNFFGRKWNIIKAK